MGFDVYRRKRDFRRTPEPRGERVPRKDSYRYVIQKHDARRAITVSMKRALGLKN